MPTLVHIRIQSEAGPAQVPSPADQTIKGYLTDINRFGMGLLTQTLLPLDTLLELEFPRSALPLTSQEPPKGSMQIIGRVVHVTPQGSQFRIGISFVRIDEIDQFLIERAMSLQTASLYSHERRRAPRLAVL